MRPADHRSPEGAPRTQKAHISVPVNVSLNKISCIAIEFGEDRFLKRPEILMVRLPQIFGFSANQVGGHSKLVFKVFKDFGK